MIHNAYQNALYIIRISRNEFIPGFHAIKIDVKRVDVYW